MWGLLFKYEKMSVVPEKLPKIILNPHPPRGLGIRRRRWRGLRRFIQSWGAMTGDIDALVHDRPLKGSYFSIIVGSPSGYKTTCRLEASGY